jgi:hypothetical protein
MKPLAVLSKMIKDLTNDQELVVYDSWSSQTKPRQSQRSAQLRYYISYDKKHISGLHTLLVEYIDITSPDMFKQFENTYMKNGQYALRELSDLVTHVRNCAAKLKKYKISVHLTKIETNSGRTFMVEIKGDKLTVYCTNGTFRVIEQNIYNTVQHQSICLQSLCDHFTRIADTHLKAAENKQTKMDNLIIKLRNATDKQLQRILSSNPTRRKIEAVLK